MNKSKLFSNLKDYNNELEKVLENKKYSQEVKNLLLSMLYKIEVSYPDYQKTKVNVISKDEFLEEIINNVNLNCNRIEFIKDDNIQVNKKEKVIKIKQNEGKCLEAICEVSQKNVEINKEYNYAVEPLKEFFNKSRIIDKTEVIRDFDGWTWYQELKNIKKIEYNLLYQCLNLVLGHDRIKKIEDNNGKEKDVIRDLYLMLKVQYGTEIAQNIMYELILTISKIFYKYDNKKMNEIDLEIEKIITEQKKYKDKNTFIENLSLEKKQNIKRLYKIDEIMNNKFLLEKEFIKRNQSGEIYFSINTLINILEREKEEIIYRNYEIDELMNPKKYAERSKQRDEKLNYLIEIKNIEIEKNIENFIINIIKCLEIKLKKSETKREIIKLIYETRYFLLLKYDKNYETENIKKTIQIYVSKLIVKAINLKVVVSIFNNLKEDIEVYKELLKMKIIDLGNIEYIIVKKNNKYKIQIWDEESLEYQKEIELLTTKGTKLEKRNKIFN